MGLGEMIKFARQEIGMTQKELAKEIGCAEVTIRQYEANRREPDYKTYRKLEDALKIALVAHPADEILNLDYPSAEANSGGPARIVLLAAYDKLNGEGQKIAVERIKELALIPQYQRTEPPEEEKAGESSSTDENPPEGL